MRLLRNIVCIVLIFVATSFAQTVKKTGSSAPVGSRKVTATAYCMGSRTASGERVKHGLIAADTRVYPFGSLILIQGLGVYRVSDTGSAIKGANRLDIYMSSCYNAKVFGRKTLLINVITYGNNKS